MKIIKILFILFLSLFSFPVLSNNQTFNDWLIDFKIYALENDISEKTY